MEPNNNKINEPNKVSNSLRLLLCPDCRKEIPCLTFSGSNNRVIFKFRCSCSKEAKKIELNHLIETLKTIPISDSKCDIHNKKGLKFCLHCFRWFCIECLSVDNKQVASSHTEFLLDCEVNIICKQHLRMYSLYCKQCHQSICTKCQNDHINHKLVLIRKIDFESFDNEYKKIDEIILRNRQKKEEFIHRIDNQIDELQNKLNELVKWKEDINAAFQINHLINITLKEFVDVIRMTASIIKTYPNYPLMKLYRTIRINQQEISVEEENIENAYSIFKRHLQNKFIIIQRKHNECIQTLKGHNDYVLCMIQLLNGQLASGSSDNTIKLWDTLSNTCTVTLTDHTDWVRCLTHLQNGNFASGSNDKSIKLWSCEPYNCYSTLIGHTDYVLCLTLLNDHRLASGSSDTTIKLWDLHTATCTHTLQGHNNLVWCLIQLDNMQIASGSSDDTIKIWDSVTLEALFTITGHNNSVYCLIQLTNGQLASSSYDKSIKLWETNNFTSTTTITGHSDTVWCLIQLEDEELVSSSSDGTIKLWNPKRFNWNTTLTGHTNTVSCMVQLHDGFLASGSYDKTIKLWNI